MSMRLALKASLETVQDDEKAKKKAARKAKQDAKKERAAELAAAEVAAAAAAEADLDDATRDLRKRVAARLDAVLKDLDLEAANLKSLRKDVEAAEDVELAGENKAWFKEHVTKLLTGGGAAAAPGAAPGALADDEEDPGHPPLSDEMTAVVGIGRANHFRIVKLLWKYIKANDLQNPSNRNEILCDEKLEAVFGKKKVTGFGMSKLIGQHIYKDQGPVKKRKKPKAPKAPRPPPREEREEGEAPDDGAAAADGTDDEAEPRDDADDEAEEAAPPPKKKARKRHPPGYRGSKALADFAGKETNNRFELTKIFWARAARAGELAAAVDREGAANDRLSIVRKGAGQSTRGTRTRPSPRNIHVRGRGVAATRPRIIQLGASPSPRPLVAKEARRLSGTSRRRASRTRRTRR